MRPPQIDSDVWPSPARNCRRPPRAHLLAAYDLGQEARTAEAGVLDRYVSLLEEHLATWPQAATADRAHLWVARVRERQQDFRRAIEQYSAVRPGTESSAEAIDGLARSYLALLADLRASGKATSTSAAAAVAALEAASEIPKDDVKWTAAQSSTVLAAARILLDYTENGFAKAEQLLSRALAAATDAPEDWKSSAGALLVFAIAAQGRSDDARRQVELLANAEPRELESLIESIERLSPSAQPALKEHLGALELRVLELMSERRPNLSEDERRALELARCKALLAAGRKDEASAAMKLLAEANPRDGRIQEAWALALFEANDPGRLPPGKMSNASRALVASVGCGRSFTKHLSTSAAATASARCKP